MSPITPSRRSLRRLGSRLMSLVLVIATVSAIIAVGGAATLRLTGRQVAVVLSGSMTPQFVAGDAVIVKPAPKPEELKVGEIVTFHAPGTEHLTTHRIVQIIHRPEGLFIQTKGDFNAAPDPDYAPAANVIGLAGTVLPKTGRFVILYTDPIWRLLTLGIPLLLLLTYHLTIAIRELRPTRRPVVPTEAGDLGTVDDAAVDADNDADTNDSDETDGIGGLGTGGEPEPTLAPRPAADRPPRPLGPARPHPARRPGVPVQRRVLAVTLGAVAIFGLSGGLTGALYTASATTHASFSTGQFCRSDVYNAAVAVDNPDLYWLHGSASADSTGTYTGSVTMPTNGAMTCSDATTFNGTGALTQSSRVRFGSTFTIETWFRSSSTQAAQIVGFGNRTASQGDSTNRERVLYVDSAGRAALSYDKGKNALTSPTSIVDGAWHYLVVTFQKKAATLYVDGRAVDSTTKAVNLGNDNGYWRAGTDTVSGLPGVGSSGRLTATLDDTAIYPTILSTSRISAHWTAAGN